jgi:hypothetical protein
LFSISNKLGSHNVLKLGQAGIPHHLTSQTAVMRLWEEGWAKGALRQEPQLFQNGYLYTDPHKRNQKSFYVSSDAITWNIRAKPSWNSGQNLIN